MPYSHRYQPTRRPYTKSKSSRYSTKSRRNYNAAQQSKAMVVTQSRTTNSANRVGANGLNRISVGRFKDLPTLWPDKFLCKMKYQDTVNTTLTIPAGGSSFSVVYRVNSLFDPLTTTAAEQSIPGFLEMGNMYGNYRVHAAKMTANVSPQNAAANTPSLVSLGFSIYNPGYTTGTVYSIILDQTGNPYNVYGMTTPNSLPLNLENYVGMKKLAGSAITDTDDRYAGPVNGNPAVSLYGFISVAQPNTPVTAAIYVSIVEIEFWAEFYNRAFEYQ